MLPLPNLDDRKFEQMVEDARKSIPHLLPDWTDENVHDPGITLVELFAWLSEMQQFHLNQITEQSERKFLKLLGIKLAEAGRARTDVSFFNVSSEFVLPSGLKLMANDQIFETLEPLLVIPSTLDRILVRTGNSVNDYTASNGYNGVSYYAFGTEPKKDYRLYLGFSDALPVNKPLTFSFRLYDQYPVQPGPGKVVDDPHFYSAKVSWKYYGKAANDTESSPSWQPMSVLKDRTRHLSESGMIQMQIPGFMTPLMLHPANDRGRYWLCCTLEEEGYEIPPRVEHISINTTEVIHQDTLSFIRTFDGTGLADSAYQTQDFLPYYKHIFVQVLEEDGFWHDWQLVSENETPKDDERVFTVEKVAGLHLTKIRFPGRIPAKGTRNIRFGACTKSFLDQRWIGQTNGLPHQTFQLKVRGQIVKDSLLIQVGLRNEQGEIVWQDWEQVDDLDSSRAHERHYIYDQGESTIRFGDNERGLAPLAADFMNIRMIACTCGGGTRGNVKHGLIREIVDAAELEFGGIEVTNYDYAHGGSEQESLEHAKKRVRKEWLRPQRAVTADDYEAIVKLTPGLRVSRAKAIPGFVKGMRDYPKQFEPGQVTVVVVPYSPLPRPMPSEGFLKQVSLHLEQYRLLGTQVHVIAPAYCTVSVQVTVVIEHDAHTTARDVHEALNHLLRPIDKEAGSGGWDFGKTVYKGDVYGVINQVPGVSFVQSLWLDAEGEGVRKLVNGDIALPPYGLVHAGEHVIEIVRQER